MTLPELRRLLAELEAFCKDAEIDAELVYRFELVLDEIFTNIINYAFPEGGKHEVEVYLSYKDGEVEMVVEDSGVGVRCYPGGAKRLTRNSRWKTA